MFNFLKMHGLGNDFVIIDLRENILDLSDNLVRAVCDRRTGIGCDQLILLSNPSSSETTVFMGIRNADGSEAGACGNATRCVADMLMRKMQTDFVKIETESGVLECWRSGNDIRVKLGPPTFEWRDIPLSKPCDTMSLPIGLSKYAQLKDPITLSVGNPHVVFFLESLDGLNINEVGPVIENDPLFPERVNVNFAVLAGESKIMLRVWERGSGATLACGTGACATAVAAMKRGLISGKVEVEQAGGNLLVEWAGGSESPVYMTGKAVHVYSGKYNA